MSGSGNKKARKIIDLSNYLQKSPITLFDTINKTFANQFIKMAQNITSNKKWLIKYINYNNYFTEGIENMLTSQKNKIYIIWNVQEKKFIWMNLKIQN